MNFARFFMRRSSLALVIIAVLLPFASVTAQDAVPVLILPVDQANFLPGALFDFRVEIHTDAMPEDVTVTVNGTDASELFGAEATVESWSFGSEENPTPAQSMIWRDLTAPEAGEYVVEVTTGGNTTSVTWTVREASTERVAQNVILFVADGMTVQMLTAARLARGTVQGLPTNPLMVDSAPFIGLSHTSSIDSPMSDSANTASALNTGHIGSINATGSYSDTSPDSLDDPRVETFASMVSRVYGMSVGVVTTADFSDATPAAVWASGRNRGNGNRNAYLVQALEAGYIDVLMGGGARRLIPMATEGSRREDERNLFDEYAAAGYTIVTTATELDTAADAERLLGVFNPNDMNVWLDRNVYTNNLGDFTDQPGLVQMTLAALNTLNQNENGFYLSVEAASVDKQIHPLDQERALSDLIEFDQALAAAAAWVAENAPDTLIVVTADHAHGYEVFGTVDVTAFNAAADDAGRRDAINTYADAQYPNYPDANDDGFPEWADATIVLAGNVNNGPDRTENFQVSETPRVPAISVDGIYVDNPEDDANGIFVSGNLPLGSGSSGVHTLADNPVFAWGPGAEGVSGVYHQREVFFIMANALGLNPAAAE